MLGGIMPETHQLSLQWCGMHGNAAANYALQEADCIIALGSRFDDRTTGLVSEYAPKAFEAYQNGTGGIIHVNIEESEIGKVIDSHYNLNISCQKFLERGINTIMHNKRNNWFNFIKKLKDKYQFIGGTQFRNETHIDNNNDNDDKLYMEDVIYNIGKKLKNYHH